MKVDCTYTTCRRKVCIVNKRTPGEWVYSGCLKSKARRWSAKRGRWPQQKCGSQETRVWAGVYWPVRGKALDMTGAWSLSPFRELKMCPWECQLRISSVSQSSKASLQLFQPCSYALLPQSPLSLGTTSGVVGWDIKRGKAKWGTISILYKHIHKSLAGWQNSWSHQFRIVYGEAGALHAPW